jgi:hypothetical protein
MMLTDLAAVARAAGLRVVEVAGWRTRGHGQMAGVKTIVCHHTAGGPDGAMPSLQLLIEGRRDLPGPLANLGLGRDGTVYAVAAGVAYHAGQVRDTSYANPWSIGIEAEATGVDDWPDVQVDAYARLCAALVLAYDLTVARVLGHKEVCFPAGRKIDPNFDMPKFRDQVDAQVEAMRPAPVSPPPARPVLSVGSRGTAVRALEARLDALGWRPGPITGVFDAGVARAVLGVQAAAGLHRDRIVGPHTWGSLDAGRRPRLELRRDVAFGATGDDVRGIQRQLIRLGPDVDDDGAFGPRTAAAVRRQQAICDLRVDGVVGEWTAAALGGVRV